jgi:hypothetical protein
MFRGEMSHLYNQRIFAQEEEQEAFFSGGTVAQVGSEARTPTERRSLGRNYGLHV